MFDTLKAVYNNFVTKFLTDHQKDKLDLHPQTQGLDLPGQINHEEEEKKEIKPEKDQKAASLNYDVESEESVSEQKNKSTPI